MTTTTTTSNEEQSKLQDSTSSLIENNVEDLPKVLDDIDTDLEGILDNEFDEQGVLTRLPGL